MLTEQDLSCAAKTIIQWCRTLENRAQEAQPLLLRCAERDNYPHTCIGRTAATIQLPSGGRFVIHEVWRKGYVVPEEVKCWFSEGFTIYLVPPGGSVPDLRSARRERRFLASVSWDQKKPHLDLDLTCADLLHELSVLKWRCYQLTLALRPANIRKEIYTLIARIERAEEDIRGSRGNRPRQLKNLITICGGDPDFIVLQLGVYAIRAGVLDHESKGGCFRRFAERFRSSVGYLSPAQKQGALYENVRNDILFEAWEAVLRGYCLPSREDAFVRYARYLIARMKRSLLSSDKDRINESGNSVRAVAAQTGISERTIYDLVRKGRLSVTTNGGQIAISTEGKAQLWEKRATQQQHATHQEYAELLAKRTGISLENTKRRIRRYRQQGLTDQQIARKIGEACNLIQGR